LIQTTGKTTIIFNQKPIAKIKINTGMKRIFSILVFAGLCYVAQGQYTFECYGGYLSGADCQICTGQTTARLFNGLIIRQGANVFRLIDCPYFIRQQGNNLIITELIPNPESVTINLLSSGFSTVTGFRDSIACMCARQDSSWIGGGGGSTYYQTWKDDGTALTQQPNANFLQSDDINISLTNDGGNTETEVSADILTNAVNYAEIQQVAANRILGNPTGSTANVAEIPLATGLFFAGGNLNVADRDSLNEAWTIDADDADLEVISNQIVKFQGGGINVTDYVPATNTLIITGTEVDGSTTNELQTIANTSDATSHTATLSNSGGSVQIIEGTGIGLSTGGTGLDGTVTVTNTAPDQTVSITGAGINVVTGTYPNFTITGTEVDGSVTNEGSLTVGAGGSNTSTIVSNTSGSTAVTVSGSTTVLVTESGSTITLQADTSLLATVNDLPGRVDSTFEKTAGGYTNKRTTTPVFRYAPLAVGSTDTTGRINILGVSTTKPGLYMRYLDASTNGFNWLKLDPDAQTDNSTVGSFYGWATNFVGANEPYSSRANHVWRFGYNVAQAGGRVLTTDANLHMAFESNFTNVFKSGRTRRGWEWHIESQDTTGGVHRVISARGAHSGSDGDISFRSDNYSFQPYAAGSAPFWIVDRNDQVQQWTDTMQTYFEKPMVGIPFWRMRNAANTRYYKMLEPDASDRLVINSEGNGLVIGASTTQFPTSGLLYTSDATALRIGATGNRSGLDIFSNSDEALRLRGPNETTGWNLRPEASEFVLQSPAGVGTIFVHESAPATSIYVESTTGDVGFRITNPTARIHSWTGNGATQAMFRQENSTGSNALYRSNATPEGAITANPGDLAQTSISSFGELYLKETGTGNTGWKPVLTSYKVTKAVPTTTNATQEVGVITHNAGGRSAFVQIDAVVAASGFAMQKRYIIPLAFSSTGGAWNILVPENSAENASWAGTNNFNLEMKTNTTGSPSGGIDTIRITRIAGSTAANCVLTIQILSGDANTTFTSTSATGTSSTTTLYAQNALSQINNKVGINNIAPARTLHVAGEARITDLSTDTPTKIVGADADGDLDTVGIGAEAELHLTNGTLGTNFHTTISPTSITANQTDYNPSGLATAWVVRLSADDGFRIIRSLVAPSYNKRITFHNAGSNSILFANQCAFSGVTASYRFDFGRDIILFPGKSIEIMYDVTSSRWRLLSKAGIYDDVEHLYFNERLNAPVSGSSGDYYFWDFVSENGIGGVAPVAGRLSGISVNTGSSATGIGYVASKDVFFENTNASGTANWAYCKALIKTPAYLSNGTEDYTIRIGFADATGGGGANDGFYFDYNHANVSGNWGCNTTNAGNTQRNNSGIAVTASTNYLLEIFFRPDLTAEYYINGTRVATNDTFVPAGTSDDLLVMAEIQKNASTAQRTLTVYTLQTSIAFVK